MALQVIQYDKQKSLEVLTNFLGCAGFVAGSIAMVCHEDALGAHMFAAACLLCLYPCIVSTINFSNVKEYSRAYGRILEACGCLVFIIGSEALLFSNKSVITLGKMLCLSGSLFFVVGCSNAIACTCDAPAVFYSLWFNCTTLKFIPSLSLYVSGSFAFLFGSSFGFFEPLAVISPALYLMGSVFFVIAAWGDLTYWYTCTALVLSVRNAETSEASEEETRVSRVRFSRRVDVNVGSSSTVTTVA